MLAARGICVTYGSHAAAALDDVSIDVARGEIQGLLGPNGAGKSTLLRVLATLQRADTGSVTVAGIDAIRDPDAARARIGFLPQEFGFPPALTPAELLDHFAVLKGFREHGSRRDAVAEMLRRVNLWSDRERAVRTLSGGMKQRLGIAVALIGAPDVVIVDEPTSALDPAERHRVYDLLIELAEERAVLLSTHLVADVQALCRSAIILHRGRVVRRGSPAELLAALHGRVFRARVSRAERAALTPDYHVVREFLISGATEVTVVADTPPDHRFEAAQPTLDDVFAVATAT